MIRLYIGKSASGKNYFLQKDIEDGYEPIISATTKPLRPEEVNHVSIVDIEGAMSYIKSYGIDNVEIILVTASSVARNMRAIRREEDSNIEYNAEEWDRRFLDDEEKFSEDKIDELCRLCGGEITMIVNEYESGLVFREARYAPEYADTLVEVTAL